jgi:hypothetical protein
VSDRGRTLRGLGAGVLSTALGIAAQASGLDSAVFQLVAWAFVGLGVVMIAISLGLSRARARAASGRRLAELLVRTGNEVLDFLQDREASVPTASAGVGGAVRHPVRAHRLRQVERAHARDTVEIYREAYAPQVRLLMNALVARGELGKHEARALDVVADPKAIHAVGMRLIEFGFALGRRI